MIEHTPLDASRLSAAAQKAVGPGPGRMMAARGVMPLSPADQVTVLYQLAIDRDPGISVAARATAMSLPEKLVAGALVDVKLDPRVLDLFAELSGDKPVVFDALVGNTSAADDTFVKLAERASSAQVDRISVNEQRLLRCPEIIAAMYLNKQARMSTVDRVVELAVRNKVRVPGLAAWDEISRALAGTAPSPPTPENDAAFAHAAEATSGDDSALTVGDAEEAPPDEEAGEQPPPEEPKNVPIDKLTVPAKIRLATLGNAFARSTLVRDPLRIVAMAAIKSPGVTEFEAARYAGNSGLSEDVIRHIASKREWTKLYGTKVALCRNPKTPLPEAMKLMPFLRDKDITNLMKSKGVPSAIVAQARKLMLQRRGGSKK